MKADLLNLVFPATCLACGKPPSPLCTNCIPEFSVQKSSDQTFFAAAFNESFNKLLSALKDQNRTALIKPLAKGLRPCLQAAIHELKPDLLVCPPSSSKNFRKRGFNPAELIFRNANLSNLPLSSKVLSMSREAGDQRGLGRAARLENLSQLFVAKKRAGRILLVDDVQTTGATLFEMRQALEQAGAEVVGSCVLAKSLSNFQHSTTN